MSYDIYLVDRDNKTIHLQENHDVAGGTLAVGGTTECWINITYNYSKFFYQALGEKGIRSLYGKTGLETIPILKEAISKLGDDITSNYWDATEGNAKEALKGVLQLAELAPYGIWKGD